jgi:hypothetical protein
MDELFSPTWFTKSYPSAYSECVKRDAKNAQGPELLYPTFNSRQSAMLFETTLRISRGHEVNTLTATAMGTTTLSSLLSFTTSEP